MEGGLSVAQMILAAGAKELARSTLSMKSVSYSSSTSTSNNSFQLQLPNKKLVKQLPRPNQR